MPGLRCIDRTCAKDFTPSGTFNNPGTKAGVSTERAADGTFTKETRTANGVELQYRISATTSECTKIAVIQMVWYTDEKGKMRRPTEAPNPVPNAPEKDKASTGPGYVIDFADDETTPYYQDNGGGDLTNGDLGRSDGHGGGSPSHISDAPTKLDRGWSKHFESWAVCIEGHDAGEVLAGVTWHLDRNGRAGFDDKNPSKPSQRFKDAVKSWEKYYNDAHPGAPYSEPSGGFKF